MQNACSMGSDRAVAVAVALAAVETSQGTTVWMHRSTRPLLSSIRALVNPALKVAIAAAGTRIRKDAVCISVAEGPSGWGLVAPLKDIDGDACYVAIANARDILRPGQYPVYAATLVEQDHFEVTDDDVVPSTLVSTWRHLAQNASADDLEDACCPRPAQTVWFGPPKDARGRTTCRWDHWYIAGSPRYGCFIDAGDLHDRDGVIASAKALVSLPCLPICLAGPEAFPVPAGWRVICGAK